MLISEGSVFIFGQNVDKVIIFVLSCLLFIIIVFINLSYRIVFGFLSLDKLICHFNIGVSFPLEIGLGVDVSFHFIFPSAVIGVSWEENFIGRSLSNLLIFS